MNAFVNALLSDYKNDCIPAEDDWYAPLIGDWNFEYSEPYGRKLKGEWIFRRVLEGMAIEDIFICPSRDTKDINPQPDGEYGVAVRMYNKEKRCYDMTYICSKYTNRLEVKKENDKIVCTVLDNRSNKWIFNAINKNDFHWQNVTVEPNGNQIINCEVFAKRK